MISCYDNSEHILIVPLYIEINNRRKFDIIIRDFSLVLYYNGKEVQKMKQIERSDRELYGNEGKYTFNIKARSSDKFNLLYMSKKSEGNSEFDEIKICYYNEKDKKIIKNFEYIENSWEFKNFSVDEDWVELK